MAIIIYSKPKKLTPKEKRLEEIENVIICAIFCGLFLFIGVFFVGYYIFHFFF